MCSVTGGHGPAVRPPALRRCSSACCNAAASVSESEAALGPNTPGLSGGGLRGSSSAVAGARATCRINGGELPVVAAAFKRLLASPSPVKPERTDGPGRELPPTREANT